MYFTLSGKTIASLGGRNPINATEVESQPVCRVLIAGNLWPFCAADVGRLLASVRLLTFLEPGQIHRPTTAVPAEADL
jgi:hypothetical protein